MAFAKYHLFSKRRQTISRISRILSHPARIEIIEYLKKYHEVCVQDLLSKLPLSQPAISHHISFLRNEGVISYFEDYPHIIYVLSEDDIVDQTLNVLNLR